MNDNSILSSVKKIIGIEDNYQVFDADLITHINSVLMALRQMGIGKNEPFKITGYVETWNDFLKGTEDYEAVKTYLALRVRLIFDPPASSVMNETIKATVNEMEFRLMHEASMHEMPKEV